MDTNAYNYNANANTNDAFCSYRYLEAVIVKKIPLRDPITNIEIDWDILSGDKLPDLKFYIKKSNETYWELETPIAINNSIYPYMWNIDISNKNYLFWDETYEFLLSNENFIGRNTIYLGSFIPSHIYNNDKIILINSNESVEIELTFVIF